MPDLGDQDAGNPTGSECWLENGAQTSTRIARSDLPRDKSWHRDWPYGRGDRIAKLGRHRSFKARSADPTLKQPNNSQSAPGLPLHAGSLKNKTGSIAM